MSSLEADKAHSQFYLDATRVYFRWYNIAALRQRPDMQPRLPGRHSRPLSNCPPNPYLKAVINQLRALAA